MDEVDGSKPRLGNLLHFLSPKCSDGYDSYAGNQKRFNYCGTGLVPREDVKTWRLNEGGSGERKRERREEDSNVANGLAEMIRFE